MPSRCSEGTATRASSRSSASCATPRSCRSTRAPARSSGSSSPRSCWAPEIESRRALPQRRGRQPACDRLHRRPPSRVRAREAVAPARLTPAEFKRVEDRAVDEAVRLQEEAGLDVVTDGEPRRYAFFGHLIDALDGFDKFGGWAIPFHDEQGGELVFKRPVVVDRLRWRRS